MKEDNFTEMSFDRLVMLRKTWLAQAKSAEDAGKEDHARYLRGKVKLVDYQLDKRRNDNLNDLFQ